MKTSDKNRAILAEVIARSWKEPAFRSSLKNAAKKTLQEAGMDIPAETDVVILENTPSIIYAILPPLEEQAKYQSRLDKATKRIGELPADVELRVLRDTLHKSHIVIPAAPVAVATGMLSDEALEQVAGGKSGTGVSTEQTAVTATTAATAAEVAVDAVEAQTVATTTSVAAEVEAVVVPCFIS